jgi:hypothetical protein
MDRLSDLKLLSLSNLPAGKFRKKAVFAEKLRLMVF